MSTDEEQHSIRPQPALWRKLKPLAREKRHEPTAAEQVLWERLRRHQVEGCQFRRQYPVDRFIVDFYCPAAHLVIEVDGSIHALTSEEDALRETILVERGLRVIRFSNEQVLTAVEDVLRQIKVALHTPV